MLSNNTGTRWKEDKQVWQLNGEKTSKCGNVLSDTISGSLCMCVVCLAYSVCPLGYVICVSCDTSI